VYEHLSEIWCFTRIRNTPVRLCTSGSGLQLQFIEASMERLSELCFPVKRRPSRYQLRSSQSNQLVSPVKLSTCGLRSFAVAGPIIWNNVPDRAEYLRDTELSILGAS